MSEAILNQQNLIIYHMQRYALFTNIGSSAHEACLLAPRTYVHEAMNIGSVINYINEDIILSE